MIILDVRNLSYNINTFRNIIKSSEEFLLSFLQLTGVPGIEPGSGVLETLILPMNYTPKCDVSLASDYNSIQNSPKFVNSFLRKSTHISAKTQQNLAKAICKIYAEFMLSFCKIIIQPLPLVVLWSDGNKPVFCLPHAASSKLLRLLQGIVCAETDMDTK